MRGSDEELELTVSVQNYRDRCREARNEVQDSKDDSCNEYKEIEMGVIIY